MAKFRNLQASFVSGELDPSMQLREDVDISSKAASKLENVYVRPQGGAFRREGLQFWDNTTSDAKARLVHFEFSTLQTYALVFTPGEFKVYRTDVVGTVQATVSSSPISSLTATQIQEMTYTQSADTLLLFHNDFQPIEITRSSHTSWSASNVTFENIPVFAYGSISTSNPSWDIQPDVTTGRVVVTGTSTPNFDSSFEGQFLNLPKGGRIFVRKVNSTSEIEGDVRVELADTSVVSSGDWEKETGYEDVMSNSRGWAQAGTFWKSRLWLGFVGERPQTILASKISDFFNFDEGSGLDDEAINITIDDDEVNRIRTLFPGNTLQIYTTGGEFSIRSGVSDPVTPGKIATQLNFETGHGSLNIQPMSVDGTTIFIEGDDDRGGNIVRQFVFNDVEQSFNAPNISITSQHLINSPSRMALRGSTNDEPSSYLYVVNGDGTVAVLNSLREQDLLAWSQFTTDGDFEDVIVSGRRAFFIVKRTINGNTKRFIERLDPDHFMDSSVLQTSGTATDSWSNLDHLDGETVQVRGDDFILDDEEVSSGSITSSEEVEKLEAGLFKASKIKSLPLSLIVEGQTFAGEWKSLQKVNVRLLESRNILVQIGGQNTRPPFRSFGSGTLDEPIETFTGWKQVMGGGIRRDVDVTITQEEPLEFNVLGFIYTLRV